VTTRPVTITGAGGLVGTALCGALAARGIPYRALVRTPERACAVRGAEAVIVGCMSDPHAVSAACEGSGAVVHLARSTHRLADLCRYDYPAMQTVIGAANANGAELHFLSSQAVFGGARTFPPPVLDDHVAPSPSTAYGAMKAAWESTARALCRIAPVVYRLPVVVPARLADGAPWLRYLLGDGFCGLDIEDRTLRVRPRDVRFARGGASFVHVEDVVETIATNLFRPQARGTVAMLADPEPISFRDLARLYADLARRNGYAVAEKWSAPAGRTGNAEEMFRFDTSVAEKRLGFASHAGKARLLSKATEWFTARITR